jgi:GT2 family glycosyltransferase
MSNILSKLDPNKPQFVLDLKNHIHDYVSIIIIHKDKPEFLNICLQSIVVMSANNNYEIVVVDNNSGPETQEFLNDIEDQVTVVRNKENLYWSAAVNKGIQSADPNTKYFIFLHSDVVIINPAWIDLMINVNDANNAGMVGLESASCTVFSKNVTFVQEWCMLVSKECMAKMESWPEELPLIGHSFIMTLKAQLKGYKPQLMQNNIAHHYRIFGIDVNEYERQDELAKENLAKVYQQVQSRSLE